MDAHFAHALANRCDIAGIAILQALDACDDLGACPDVTKVS
jgi:hypothetical protein